MDIKTDVFEVFGWKGRPIGFKFNIVIKNTELESRTNYSTKSGARAAVERCVVLLTADDIKDKE